MESLVSLGWCIRRGTRGEGDGDADYLPPTGSLISSYKVDLCHLLKTLVNQQAVVILQALLNSQPVQLISDVSRDS